MRHPHKLKQQRGSALLIVLALATFSALSMLAMENYLSSGRFIARKKKIEREFHRVLTDIKSTLSNESFCNASSLGLTGLRLQSGANLNSLEAPAGIMINFPGANQPLFGPGWTNANNSLRFHNMRWEHVETKSTDFARATAAIRTKKVLYRLIVEMKICDDPACSDATSRFLTNASRVVSEDRTGASITPFRQLNPYAMDIEIYMHLDANSAYDVTSGSTVRSCFGKDSGADFCEAAGGVWNPNASAIAMRCEPLKVCHTRAATNDSCGTDPEILARFSPIIEGVGKLRPGARPARGVSSVTPPSMIDRRRVNVSMCAWCNPNL